MRVLVVEDEFFVSSHIQMLIKDLNYEVAACYYRGKDFMEKNDWNFDVALLDIYLDGDITGLDIAKQLKTKNKPFVFLTANQDAETIKEIAKLEPKGYLSKPFKDSDVHAALEILSSGLGGSIKVHGIYGDKNISCSEVLYIKSEGNNCKIETLIGAYSIRKTLKELQGELPNCFVQIHRSFIVNGKHIEESSGKQVVVNNHVLPVSKTYAEILKRKLEGCDGS